MRRGALVNHVQSQPCFLQRYRLLRKHELRKLDGSYTWSAAAHAMAKALEHRSLFEAKPSARAGSANPSAKKSHTWRRPNAFEEEGDGHIVVGRRVLVEGHGAGVVKSFVKPKVGASSNVIWLDACGEEVDEIYRATR